VLLHRTRHDLCVADHLSCKRRVSSATERCVAVTQEIRRVTHDGNFACVMSAME
jgi:hypothetical protein